MASSTTAVNSFRSSGSAIGNGVLKPIKASATIIKGCMTKSSGGYLIDGADAAGRFGGIATATVTGGASDGLTSVRTKDQGIYAFAKAGGSAATDMGQLATMSSNQEYDLAAGTTNDEIVGLIVGWDTADGKWVSGAKALINIGIRA